SDVCSSDLGEAGEVVATWPRPVEPGVWLTVRCSRHGEAVTLEVGDAAGKNWEQVTVKGATGALDFPVTTPFGVGAKVLADGQVPTSSSDQLNGVVDEVHFDVP